LAALDLPERAAPIVSKMMHGAGPGKDKAELGLRLATLDLQLNDLAGVQEALRESEAGDLPAELAESRLILMARALAGGGQVDQALVAIAPLGSDAALDLKASLLARRGDWAGTTDTLLALAQHNQSRAGKPEPAEQDRLLKLASAASRSGDKTRVEQVRSIGAGRFADPGKEALFHLLTSDPTVDDADPAKVTSEIADLRQTRAALDAIAK
jgi:hypothetical protein